MTEKQELGTRGEELAKELLIKKGYNVMHTNWRHGHFEIDIVAIHNNFLVIVEVKTRSSSSYGFPDEAVDYQKIDFLAEAGAAYQEKYDIDLEFRFDIISITFVDDKPKIFHIEEAFLP